MISNIQTAIDDFITHLNANGRGERTIAEYARRLNCLLELQDLELATSRQVEMLIARLRASGISLATLAGYIQAIKTFFKWACLAGLIRGDPSSGIKKLRLTEHKPKAMRQVDLDSMITRAKATGRILEYTALLFLADTGCRVGELISLNLEDVDLARMEATCRGKTGERTIDFTEITAAALRAWLIVRPPVDRRAFFTTRKGGRRVTHSRLYYGFRCLARELGISRFNPHAIRHRVGQGWIDQGANLELVRQKLGHHDITTTAMIYGNQDRPRIRAATKRYSLVKSIR